MTESLTKLRRNSPSEAIMLLADVQASPGTIRLEGTYIKLKGATTKRTRYRNPAIRAVLRSDVLSMLCDISIPPHSKPPVLPSFISDSSFKWKTSDFLKAYYPSTEI
jgi:hypothetical protein